MKEIKKDFFTKQLFIDTIYQIEYQYIHDKKCSDAFKTILPNDYISQYDNHRLQNQLIKILKIATNDNQEHSWIDYYIYELEFGNKWKPGNVEIKNKSVRLKTPSDLWDLLMTT